MAETEHKDGSHLPEAEQVEILVEMARNSESATARIQAIKLLREIDSGEQPSGEAFARLDELAPKRDFRRSKAA